MSDHPHQPGPPQGPYPGQPAGPPYPAGQPGQPYPGAGYADHAYGKPGQPPQGPPPVATQRRRSLILGLVVGLVVGAGGLGLAWGLSGSGSDGIEADAEAVCGIVERSVIPNEDTPPNEFRRWGVSEVAVSLAARDSRYQPLADELEKALRAMQTFDFDEMTRASNEAKRICAEL